jgi:riboflavin kinase / FMN adenylyltransferase
MTGARVLSFEPNSRDTALAIGNFDGVHRGHQALVAHTLGLGRQHGLRTAVMTFDPHPAVVLGGSPPPVLTRMDRKVELLRAIAASIEVVVQRFDQAFSMLSPLEFVERILVEQVHVREVVVGANFRFGRDRAGTVAELREFGERFGFVAHPFALSGDAEGSISSSRIRRLLLDGDVGAAADLLGRPHAVTGNVVTGDGRGRTIGIPTANLDAVEETTPRAGVYACQVEIVEGGMGRALGAAVVHLGPRPTVDRGETIEVHVIDRSLDLYGKTLRVGFLQRLRDLERFSDIERLRRQIERDIAAARLVRGLVAS